MKRTTTILAALCLTLALSACSNNSAESSLRLEITPNTVRYDRLYDTYVNVSITNVTNRDIEVSSYFPLLAYHDGIRRIYGYSMHYARKTPVPPIKPQETVDLWTELGATMPLILDDMPMIKKDGMTYGDLFDIFTSAEIKELTSGAPNEPRLYRLTIYGTERWSNRDYWYAEFTVTPPLSQVILRYVIISAAALTVLGLLLLFINSAKGQRIRVYIAATLRRGWTSLRR